MDDAPLTFLGPVKKVQTGRWPSWQFQVLTAPAQMLLLTYGSQSDAKRARLVLAKAKNTHKVGSEALFKAINALATGDKHD